MVGALALSLVILFVFNTYTGQLPIFIFNPPFHVHVDAFCMVTLFL